MAEAYVVIQHEQVQAVAARGLAVNSPGHRLCGHLANNRLHL